MIWDRASVPALAGQLLDKVETVKLHAYLDSAGNPTIGCGSRTMPDGRPVRLGDTVSAAQADALSNRQTLEWVGVISGVISAPIPIEWAAALISFVHNLGRGRLPGSTLAAMLNAGRLDLAGRQLNGWVLVDGRLNLGVMRRREFERRITLGQGMAAYDPVWQLGEGELMPLYRQSFTDAAAFHAGSKVAPGPSGTLTFAHSAVADDAETDALNAAQLAAHRG